MSQQAPSSAGDATPVAVGTAVIALGDSIAAGIGAPHISEGCMALLAGLLATRHPGLRLVNLAVPGEESAGMLRRGGQVDRAVEAIAEVVAAGGEPSPLVLSIGGNDVIQAHVLGDTAWRSRFRDNLDQILGRLDAALRAHGLLLRGRACVQTVYNPFELHLEGVTGMPARNEAVGGGHNAVIRDVAARFGVAVADVSAAFRGRAHELTWVRTGDIHPTAEGHRLIAELYARACGVTP